MRKSFLRQYWLLTFVIIYNAVNLFVFCLYNAAIFDPWQFIGIFMFLIAGPVIAIISLVMLIKDFIKKKKDLNFRLSIVCIASVIIWSIGVKWIGYYGRHMAFKLVAKHNEKQVIKAIRNMKDPNLVFVSKFRYPFFSVHASGPYKDGALFIILPGAPGVHDGIVYDPNNIVPKEGWEHLTGSWYFHYAD